MKSTRHCTLRISARLLRATLSSFCIRKLGTKLASNTQRAALATGDTSTSPRIRAQYGRAASDTAGKEPIDLPKSTTCEMSQPSRETTSSSATSAASTMPSSDVFLLPELKPYPG